MKSKIFGSHSVTLIQVNGAHNPSCTVYTHTRLVQPHIYIRSHLHTHHVVDTQPLKRNVIPVAMHKTQIKFLHQNEPVILNALTACPYNGLGTGIHWPRYVLRSDISLQ